MEESEYSEYLREEQGVKSDNNSWLFNNAYHSPGIALSTLPKSSHIILTIVYKIFTIVEMLGNMPYVAWVRNSRNGVAIKDCLLPNPCSSPLPK